MTELTNQKNELAPLQEHTSLKDYQAIFYMMNAKPDTSIQFLHEKKNICLDNLLDLNERILRKLENHELKGQITAVTLILDKGRVKEYGGWEQFKTEPWNTINNKTAGITLVWDFSIKLPAYINPQRHTLKLRLGNTITPKELLQLVVSSEDINELIEARAEGVIKVDFIDQVIANELTELVKNWYEGLNNIQSVEWLQSKIEKHQRFLATIINNFMPLIFFVVFYNYRFLFQPYIDAGDSIQIILILYSSLLIVGLMVGKKLSKWLGKRIDKYEEFSCFEITRGDENSVKNNQSQNKKNTNSIIKKIFLFLLSIVASVIIKAIIFNS